MDSNMHNGSHLTALGWTTFALYMIAALLSFRAAASVRSQSSAVRSQQSFETGRVWVWLGVILAALGLNKQLDLQTLLIGLGRQIAGAEDLSASHAGLHVLFFLAFALALAALFIAVRLRFSAAVGRFARRLPLTAVGCVLVCAYIVIRAASITRVDLMLGFDLERIPFLWLLEAGGLLLIIVQALRKPNEN
jgi:hypothetical protein